MPPLADFQAGVRAAIVGGDASALAPILVGGREPLRRLAIHRRHYETSLARALTEKFPATVWLVGSEFVTESARAFALRHPPSAPCIAEYGAAFPAFLAERPDSDRAPWLRWIAELEWHVGHTVLALELAPLAPTTVAGLDPGRLPDCTLRIQPGLRHLAASWPVDDLLRLFLSEEAPPQYAFDPLDVFLEVRGARGAFTVARLDCGAFAFRSHLAGGAPIGDAAERAAEIDPAFDVGAALAAMLADGLITGIADPHEGERQ